MKIIRTDRELETPLIDTQLREWGHELVLLPAGISEAELCHEVTDAGLLLMCYTPITKEVIAAAQQLKGIVKYGVGIDAIDIPAAHARGIAVVNIPEYAEETVAEGAFALLIALVKRLPQFQAQMQSDGWAWPNHDWLANDIAGKTLGIVGCGKIGSSMARMAGAGFRVRMLGYDPCKSREQLAAAGIEKCAALQAMLADHQGSTGHHSFQRSAPAIEGVIRMIKAELGRRIYQVSNIKGVFTLHSGQTATEYL
jgi:D-3-phosphoglycerate dehydrogenase